MNNEGNATADSSVLSEDLKIVDQKSTPWWKALTFSEWIVAIGSVGIVIYGLIFGRAL